MKKIIFHLLFLVIAAGTILSSYSYNEWSMYIFKPLIMIWIGGYFLFHARYTDRQIVKLTLAAFLFSWLGDIFMMFTEKGEVFFASGVFAFLVAQIFYIILFLKTITLSGKKPFLKKQPYWLIAYIAYGMLFAILLYGSLDTILKIAIFFYITAILSMSAMALNRFGNGHPVSFTLVFTGSILFIISDSIIAIDRFLFAFEHARSIILFTYILAQYLIMRGILKQYE
jgi:uncharacterized membrane protein YhhN